MKAYHEIKSCWKQLLSKNSVIRCQAGVLKSTSDCNEAELPVNVREGNSDNKMYVVKQKDVKSLLPIFY